MPIRPEMKARYPKDWKAIRERIRQRAGNRCEWCGIPNHVWVVRYADDWMQRMWCGTREEAWKLRAVLTHMAAFRLIGPTGGITAPVRVVCTTAHVHDHEPENCDDGNLAFLCQSCHLKHDAKLHAANAAETRRKRKGQMSLLELPEANP